MLQNKVKITSKQIGSTSLITLIRFTAFNLLVHNLRSTCLVLTVFSLLHLHLKVGRHLISLQLQFLFRQPFFSLQLQIFDSFSYAQEMSNITDHVGRRRALGSSRSRTSSHPNLQMPVALVQRDLLDPTGGLRRTQISMYDIRIISYIVCITYVQFEELDLTNIEETWGKVTSAQKVHK